MKIAAIQMISTPVLEENLARAEALIDEASAAGATFIQLPEYFCLFGQSEKDKFEIAEDFGVGKIQNFLASKAHSKKIWLSGGTIPLRCQEKNKVTNTLLLFTPEGELAARYDKLHLFSMKKNGVDIDEGRTMIRGDKIVVAPLTWGKVGLSICYDLRFPELYRLMGKIDLLLLPSAFTFETGKAHWEILIRARAIENQCYVLATNQGGQHKNGRRTYGHSMVVDPWGTIMSTLEEGEGIVYADMDLAKLEEIRQLVPALANRRFFDGHNCIADA